MNKHKPVIGVLALQGAVTPHQPHIEAAGAEFRAVKTPKQFDEVDGFILPGGESTTMLKLIDRFGLWDDLVAQFKSKPVWGICAGSILMAEKVTNPEQKSFALLPITVQRNGYGRQIDSHHDTINGYPVSLIRAPVITDVKEGVSIVAEHQGTPVWLRARQYMVTTFHPELTLDFPSPMHKEFAEMIKTASSQKAA